MNRDSVAGKAPFSRPSFFPRKEMTRPIWITLLITLLTASLTLAQQPARTFQGGDKQSWPSAFRAPSNYSTANYSPTGGIHAGDPTCNGSAAHPKRACVRLCEWL